jgi:hypothetical protein
MPSKFKLMNLSQTVLFRSNMIKMREMKYLKCIMFVMIRFLWVSDLFIKETKKD